MKLFYTLKSTALIILTTTLFTTPVWADRYTQQVRAQLAMAGVLVANGGYRISHDIHTDVLRRRQASSLTLTLRRGQDYALVGVCDSDCSDIDLQLYDENGKLITQDKKRNDMPVVEVTPRWTGQFRLRVTMYSCRTRDCVYGVGVFTR